MIYVGIDIAKLNHFASAISSDGEVLIEPFKFTNDNDGFLLLLSKLSSFDKSSLIIGLESTAHYGNNLLAFLVPKGFQVCLINPIQTSTMRKNNIRKTKTDKVDTFIICKTLMMQPHRFVTLLTKTLNPYIEPSRYPYFEKMRTLPKADRCICLKFYHIFAILTTFFRRFLSAPAYGTLYRFSAFRK